MIDMHHRIGINASVEAVYAALTTDEGLTKWWTNDVSGAGEVGSTIKFRFNGGGPDFTVSYLIPNKTVCWKHSGNIPEAWSGTEITFQLKTEDNQTYVNFTHANWTEPTNFMAHCNMKWAVFLLSLKDALKDALETGTGKPFPNDIQIDHT